jgi:hypothetical protein
MEPTSSSAVVRRALEERFARLLDDIAPVVDRQVAGLADHLNQAARRLRQAEGWEEIGITLVDAASAFCQGAALFRIEGATARAERLSGGNAERFTGLEIALDQAAAFGGAVETKDPVIAITFPAEVSSAMIEVAGHDVTDRASLFPIVARDRVEGILYCWGAVHGAPIELLTQVAGLSVPPPPPPPAELISIAPLAPQPEAPAPTTGRPAWEALPADDQRLHLRAQRFARVEVAEIRLYQAEAVHAGRLHRDVYGAVRDAIDTAREKFRYQFVQNCPSMVDYLHLEVVKTLANGHASLLGEEYPGPLV